MDRAPVIVIAVVVAALVLFGLRFFAADDPANDLAGAGRRVGDVASAPRVGFDAADGQAAAGSGRPVGARPRGNSPAGGAGGVARSGEPGRGGPESSNRPGGSGAARVFGGAARPGGSVGVSGSSAAERGSDGTVATLSGGAGRAAPRAALKDEMVEKLSARPPVANVAEPPVDGDSALTVTKPADISDQAGQAEEVHPPDEGGDGIKISERGRVEFPNAGNASETGSIAFQIKPDWAGGDQSDNALVQIRSENEWKNQLQLVKNGEFLRFLIHDDTGREADISARISDWQPNEPHDIQVEWGDGRTRLIIDGQVAGSNTYTGTLAFPPGTPMFLGSDYRGSTYNGANATLYDFTLRNGTTARQ
jgi:hypothetical protein